MNGDELRKLLNGAERSAGWLAAHLGVSRTHVNRWLRDETPVAERHLERIRELLAPVPQ